MEFIIKLFKGLFSIFIKNREGVAKETIEATTIKKEEPTPQVVMGDASLKEEVSIQEEPKVKKPLTIINNSKGYSYFTQRNNGYQGNYACSCTSYVMMLLYNKLITRNDKGRWVNQKGEDLIEINKEWIPDYQNYTQLEDHLMIFTQNNPDVLAYYEKHYNNLYCDWIKERKELRDKGIKDKDMSFKSYPANELHIVLAYSVNKFLHMDKELVEYKSQGMDSIVDRLKRGESLLISGTFEGLNHIICVCGLAYNDDGVDYIIADDPWKKTLNYKKDLSGNDSDIPYQTFVDLTKPKGLSKGVHVIKR